MSKIRKANTQKKCVGRGENIHKQLWNTRKLIARWRLWNW